MASILLVFGGSSQMLVLYGGCILLVILLLGVKYIHHKFKAFILKKRKEKEELQNNEIYNIDQLFLGAGF